MPTTRSRNPFTGEVIGEYELGTRAQIDDVLGRAAATQRQWARWSFERRAAVLEAVAARLEAERDALAGLCTREMGKRIDESHSEVEKCAWVCRYYAENAKAQLADELLADDEDANSFVSREPLGVILAIMPWNFPYWQAFRCAAPALMAGNTVVLKHAGNVSGCSLALERLFREASGDQDIFRSIIATGETASELVDDPRIAGVSLTGSARAGRAVGSAAGKALKPSVLELGGSDPFVVLDLADEDSVLETAVTARYMNAGQSCIAAKRFIVVDEVYDRFVEAFVERARKKTFGDPMQAGPDTLAPMAREDLRDDLAAQVEDTRRAGARVVLGGEVPERAGWFYPATVLLEVPEGSPGYGEELFGPAATIFRVAGAEAAVELANASPYGLGGTVWSGDVEKAVEVARRIESGAVYVNRQMASDPRLPFGGIKHSGYGRELSHLGIREFVNDKTISIRVRG